ncbi:hypothetical protein M427DRAFT_54135 [Gonapodya prolifera JEL478]|uniref:Uncharacterized protein n=1 Tax=Gonapodya prolifera (strain JEL478) TaxID=1344416 RepID=A0A139AN32_GONPJ|nr:hypothetical protein M427DRAFT_54135 [Gonapodya prolifera JEL478]|eukprot:KXS17885.1 hypothetical protein M427DRAFT_54135 [Gonapodya prolifera JEL478]
MTDPSDTATVRNVLFAATAVVAAGVVAYALYFDYQRRNDPNFRRKLKAQRKKAAVDQKLRAEQKAAAEKQQREADPASVLAGPGSGLPAGVGHQPFAAAKTVDERAEAANKIVLAMEEDKEDPLPANPADFELYCKNHILQGELLFRQGPQYYDVSAVAFFKALIVYERPMDLLMILQRSIPEEVLISILDLFKAYTTREAQKRRQAYFAHFPDPGQYHVKVQERIEDGTLRRSLVALKDVAQGEVVYEEEPLLAALEAKLEGSDKYCTHCLRYIAPASGRDAPEEGETTESPKKFEKNGLVFCSESCLEKSNELWDQFLTPTNAPPVDTGAEPGDLDTDGLDFDPAAARATFSKLLKHSSDINSSHPLIIARFYALLVGERREQLLKLAKVAAGLEAGGEDAEAGKDEAAEANKHSVLAHLERMQYIDMEALEKDKEGAGETDASEVEMISEILGPQLPGLEEVLNDEQYRKMRGKLLYNAYGIHFDPNPTPLPVPEEPSPVPEETSPAAEESTPAPEKPSPEQTPAESSSSPKPTKRPIRSSESLTENPVTGTALYLVSSYASHSCDPSATLAHVDGTSRARIVAARDIKEGDVVSLAWADVTKLESVEDRRKILKAGWGFICECEKCGKKPE